MRRDVLVASAPASHALPCTLTRTYLPKHDLTQRETSLTDSYLVLLGGFDLRRRVINFGGDNGNLTPHLDDSLAFVKSGAESGGVLIHCTHGTGRSAAVAIAAAMKAQGDGTPGGVVGGFPEAFRLVKSRRPGTDPPMPFQLELDAWQKEKSKSA